MSVGHLLSQIKTMELQLAGLKAQVRQLDESAPAHSFAELRGHWAGQPISDEDLRAAKYRFEWEGEELGGTA